MPSTSPSPSAVQALPHWVVFAVDDGKYAVPLAAVERVAAAAEVTPLPGAPGAVRGAANVAGDVLPVFDLRRRFSLQHRALQVSDQFLIVHAAGRRAILLIDSALGLLDGNSRALVETRKVAPGMPHIGGVIVSDEGLVLIHDVDAFLTEAESRELDAAMARGAGLAT